MTDRPRNPGIILSAELLHQVKEIAFAAGARIMDVYGRDAIGETRKQDGSPLTQADLAAHRAIMEGLARLTPDVPILSEEGAAITYAERKAWEQFWLVDPLDGTKEFIKRNGEFTVNIALVQDARPVMGVVYAPVLDVCYFAARGFGAFVQRGQAAAGAIAVTNPVAGEPLKVVASRSHGGGRTEALLGQLGSYESVTMGSSLKFCLVAEGAAHLYPRLGPTMEWDTAAAHAVVNEAGGRVCALDGVELHYNKPDLHNPEFLALPADEGFLHMVVTMCARLPRPVAS
jgi:3'(2'), 5'-bisphosphate nucleotidase